MKQPSFWEKDSFLRPYDLIVIGAGIVGLSSALFYKKSHPHSRVLCIDKAAMPEGASTRNAGFACVGSITEHMADMQTETKINIKKRFKRRYNGLKLLRKTLGDEAIEYDKCGGYELFTDRAVFDEATSHVPEFNKWIEDVTGETNVYQAKKLNGYPVIYNRLEGALHPGKMMQQLIALVQASGIIIQWNSCVKKMEEAGAVVLNNGYIIEGTQILIATNGFTKRLLPKISVEPARGLIIVSQPWPDIPWKGIFHYDRGYIYFRNIGNRLLLGGGRDIAADEEKVDQFGINTAIKEHLQKFARQTLHLPDGLSFEHEWSGIMGFSPTKTPILKRLNAHHTVAAGLSGMGIAIGMDVGKMAAKILSEP